MDDGKDNIEDKFIVINKKFIDCCPNKEAKRDFLCGLRKMQPWLPKNEYIVCNRDEFYADNVLSEIIKGEDYKESLS